MIFLSGVIEPFMADVLNTAMIDQETAGAQISKKA